MKEGSLDVLKTMPRLSPAWVAALAALVIVWLALGIFHFETFRIMEGVWSGSETFAHAYVVPLISLWLVWRLRARVLAEVPRPWLWGLVPIALLEVLLLLGHMTLVNVISQLAAVSLVIVAVPLVLGWRIASVMLFPLGFLLFAVPIGDFMMPQLMEWTADFTVMALRLSGIPVYREGLQFVIPSGNWSVVEACSGIRYLIASLMVGALFAYLNYRSHARRWAFMLFALVLPILANWVRAYMIVMIGHLSDNRLAVGVDHLIYGWVFFGVVIMVMFMIGARWAEPDEELQPSAADHAGVGVQAWARPWQAALAASALVAFAQLGTQWLDRLELQAAAPVLELPPTLAGRPQQSDPLPVSGWAPHFQDPRTTAHRRYADNGDTVGVHVAYFRGQDFRSKLVNSMHAVVKTDDNAWNLQGLPDLQIAWRDQTLSLPLVQVQSPPRLGGIQSQSLIVARVYWVDGAFTASPVQAKVLGAVARLKGRGDDGALVMIYVSGTREQRQRELMRSIGASALADLSQALSATRDRR